MSRFKTLVQSLFLLFFIALLLNSCKKDKLTGDLEVFKGRYTWTHSEYKKEWWHSYLTTVHASSQNYTAEIEFTDKGKINFFIDGELIHKTGYSIKEQNQYAGWLSIEVDPSKEDSKQLDLNNTIGFDISGDTLKVSTYPGDGYDSSFGGGNYFIRN